MRVTVKYFTALREVTEKRREEVELSGSVTVEGLLRLLSKKYGPRFTDYVYDEHGKVRSHLQFLVNGRSITTLQGFGTRLKDGEEFAIIPPVGGG